MDAGEVLPACRFDALPLARGKTRRHTGPGGWGDRRVALGVLGAALRLADHPLGNPAPLAVSIGGVGVVALLDGIRTFCGEDFTLVCEDFR